MSQQLQSIFPPTLERAVALAAAASTASNLLPPEPPSLSKLSNSSAAEQNKNPESSASSSSASSNKSSSASSTPSSKVSPALASSRSSNNSNRNNASSSTPVFFVPPPTPTSTSQPAAYMTIPTPVGTITVPIQIQSQFPVDNNNNNKSASSSISNQYATPTQIYYANLQRHQQLAAALHLQQRELVEKAQQKLSQAAKPPRKKKKKISVSAGVGTKPLKPRPPLNGPSMFSMYNNIPVPSGSVAEQQQIQQQPLFNQQMQQYQQFMMQQQKPTTKFLDTTLMFDSNNKSHNILLESGTVQPKVMSPISIAAANKAASLQTAAQKASSQVYDNKIVASNSPPKKRKEGSIFATAPVQQHSAKRARSERSKTTSVNNSIQTATGQADSVEIISVTKNNSYADALKLAAIEFTGQLNQRIEEEAEETRIEEQQVQKSNQDTIEGSDSASWNIFSDLFIETSDSHQDHVQLMQPACHTSDHVIETAAVNQDGGTNLQSVMMDTLEDDDILSHQQLISQQVVDTSMMNKYGSNSNHPDMPFVFDEMQQQLEEFNTSASELAPYDDVY